MSFLFRLAPLRPLLWWFADHGLFRHAIEEALKRKLVSEHERAEALSMNEHVKPAVSIAPAGREVDAQSGREATRTVA